MKFQRYNCKHCGEEFERRKLSTYTPKFCSMKCANEYQTLNPYRGERKERIIQTCKECDREFAVLPSRADRNLFCSTKCQYTWRSKKMSDKGNPNWQGGISRLPYPFNWKEISAKVIETQRVCMNPMCGYNGRLVTHHINYDKTDCGKMNLICLCEKCNSAANFNKKEWEILYANINKTFYESIDFFNGA